MTSATLRGDVGIAVKGSVPVTGGVRYYQVWYRNSAAYSTAPTFSLKNALKATWVP